ncbi:hypothetical protein PICST_31800 [Scheffersomyces stipitis CBS 6054]|uniref:Uncharacterized protein n=1 Tax=Scheffersomyces stipitis (strain ATCC 58785 / CBS 6054 / NBRC 10063 / NRRL Y-11545) TaxID=322104 RepID=A3LUK9_PICST|nr:hypothetical protein PICST_31800 [Scheffersomyces stipitis CBS 6054]ABN66611.2 hypothetical protein PICST_31800 [Scheffersomyces stipitis CBS 6054]KAG2732900.1 hypothetical protein G9P44_003890 [Scheffersomyces stipitis]
MTTTAEFNYITLSGSTSSLELSEFQDYLTYSTVMPIFEAPAPVQPPRKMSASSEEVPQRSPARPSKLDFHKLELPSSPTSRYSMSDASSFEEKSTDYSSISEASIFTRTPPSSPGPEIRTNQEVELDEFGLDLNGIDEEELFEEMQLTENGKSSNVIFEIDTVITVVGIHDGTSPLSYIHVKAGTPQ